MLRLEKDAWMLRLLALLLSFALMLAPFGPAQADTACTMLAAAEESSSHSAHHQMPGPGHSAQSCKQMCVVVAILTPDGPVVAQAEGIEPCPRPAARALASQRPDPSERPPKV